MRKIKCHPAAIGMLLVLTACSTPPEVRGEGAGFEKQPHPGELATRQVVAVQSEIEDCDLGLRPVMPRSVFFNFDSYVVKPEGQDVVQNHAAYLGKNQRTILILGNTDERGGSEYNLALGQKRAEALRKSLAALGVADSRMEAVSLGKEKPMAEGHNEEGWALNRRADIVYKAK